MTASLAVAPTGLAALWLARGGGGSLETLPLEATGFDLDFFRGIGVATVGEALALPRDGLAQRCGSALVDALDRAACGRRPETYAFFAPPASFSARLELPGEAAHAEALLFPRGGSSPSSKACSPRGTKASAPSRCAWSTLIPLPRNSRSSSLACPGMPRVWPPSCGKDLMGKTRTASRGDRAARRRFHAARAAQRRPVRRSGSRRGRLGAAARAPAHPPGLRGDLRPRHAARSPARACLAPGRARANGIRASSGSRARGRCGCWSSRAAWRVGIHAARRAGAHRVRLVGRRRGEARLLHRPAGERRRRLDLPRRRRMVLCMACLPDYAELHCLSNFSFLRGASHPEELVERAARARLSALALTDECSLAGARARARRGEAVRPEAHLRHRGHAAGRPKLVLLATDRHSYGAISFPDHHRSPPRQERRAIRLQQEDVEAAGRRGSLVCCSEKDGDAALGRASIFRGRAWIAAELHVRARTTVRSSRLARSADSSGLPLVAAGDVHMHLRSRQPLQDVADRDPPGTAGARSAARRCTRTPSATCGCACAWRSSIRRSCSPRPCSIAARCAFSLDELRYEYPEELVPPGETPASWLRKLTERGLALALSRTAFRKRSATWSSASSR